MSDMKNYTTARPVLVPEGVALGYTEAMARLPRVQLAVRRFTGSQALPAVGSFHG